MNRRICGDPDPGYGDAVTHEEVVREIAEKMRCLRIARRLILFGGSFDPFHRGHLLLAEQAARIFAASVIVTAVGRPTGKPLAMDLAAREAVIDFSIAERPWIRRWGENDSLNFDNAARLLPDHRIFKLFGFDTLCHFLERPDGNAQIRTFDLIIHRRPGCDSHLIEDCLRTRDYDDSGERVEAERRALGPIPGLCSVFLHPISLRFAYLLEPVSPISSSGIRMLQAAGKRQEAAAEMVNAAAAHAYLECPKD